MKKPIYITSNAAAKQLGLSPEGVRHLIRVGTLPAVQFGRQYLIDPADVARVGKDRPGPGPRIGKRK